MPDTREPVRLHIGGKEARAGWKILHIVPGPQVDYVGDGTDLSRFADGSVAEVYASHVLEHLGYQDELPRALAEIFRVLVPDGLFRISVPDLDTLCLLFIEPMRDIQERADVMRMLYGEQTGAHDFHKVGLSEDLLAHFLEGAGFRAATRVINFGMFDDRSTHSMLGRPISLNVIAQK